MVLNPHPIYPSTLRRFAREIRFDPIHRRPARPHLVGELQEFTGKYEEITTLRLAAKAAYQMADAMLAERAK